MRFRKLNFEELTSLEKEFKEFLIINHIHDEEWRNLNKEAPEKVSALVEVFSDTVLLKVYGKISYLEFYGEDILSFFKIDKEWINSIHIQVSNSGYELPKQIDEILTYPEKSYSDISTGFPCINSEPAKILNANLRIIALIGLVVSQTQSQ